MAPIVGSDKIARALVIAAERLCTSMKRSRSSRGNHYHADIDSFGPYLDDSNKIHVIFPKKRKTSLLKRYQSIIACYLRKNPVVETRQFYFKDKKNDLKYEMLHAKQMVLVLENAKRNWTKYVKFGGSYNPAGQTL